MFEYSTSCYVGSIGYVHSAQASLTCSQARLGGFEEIIRARGGHLNYNV